MTSSPLGAYTYGSSAHPDAATAFGSARTASYDTNGDLLCCALTSATTCPQSGTQTGAHLRYDNEDRLSSWQDAPTSPTVTDSFLYDGEGHRVQQVVTSGGTTTTTSYISSLEEIATTGSTTTTTAYYGGVAESVNGTLSYTLTDNLGSVSVALSTLGAVTASQLYGPYGAVRYSNGSLPGTRAYTGQRADATTGLDYYTARYYDPVAGQFTSADTALTSKKDAIPTASQLNRYAYVGGNPETRTDPTGHRPAPPGDMGEPPPPNNDNWTDYGPDIVLHRHDGDIRGPWFDDRWHVKPEDDKNHKRAYTQEQKDGPVLVQYFGLTVEWQDESKDPGRTADYLVGLDTRLDEKLPGWLRLMRIIAGSPALYSSDFEDAQYGTPVDLYYPEKGTSSGNVRDKIADKHNQAPIVAVDISDNTALQGMSPNELQSWANNVIKPGGKSTVNRVIVINNGVVVYDTYTVTPWGPPPAGSSGGS